MSEDMEDATLRKELEETYKGFIKAVKTKNIDDLSNYYTEDCHLIFEGGVKISGREDTVKTLIPILKDLIDFNIEIHDVYSISNTSAIEIGENTLIEEINGEIKTSRNKYVAQWEKQSDGKWQAKIDVGLQF